jgi:UTP--glucose-1-phosphate uridylyltransferase
LQRTKPGKGGEIQLTDAIRMVLHEGGRVYGLRLSQGEKRFDIGNYDAYFRAFVEFALADEKYGASLRRFLKQLLHETHP